MAIPVAELREELRGWFVDDDGDISDPVMRFAINYAIRSVVRFFPDLTATDVNRPVQNGKVTIDRTEHESLIRVWGILGADGKVCQPLRPKYELDVGETDPCWTCNTDTPETFIFNPQNRFEIYIIGSVPDGSQCKVTVSGPPPILDQGEYDSSISQIELPQRHHNDLVNAALARLETRSTAPQNQKHAFSDQTFRTDANIQLQMDNERNPNTFVGMKRIKG